MQFQQAVVAAVVSHFTDADNLFLQVASLLAKESADDDGPPRKRSSRYRRGGAIPHPKHSVWGRTVKRGDDLEFLHFTSLSRSSFYGLVDLCKSYINTHPIDPRFNPPKKRNISRRMFTATDIVAMALRYILSTAENKDLHVQFGAVETTFKHCVKLGLRAIVEALVNHPKARVF